MRRSPQVALLAFLAVAGCRSAVAQTQGFDANGDGKISRAEFVAARTARFAQMDRNGDGTVNAADFPRAQARPNAAARIDRIIASADINRDGQVTRAELSGAGTPLFDRADRNHDGFVDQSEVAALKSALAARR